MKRSGAGRATALAVVAATVGLGVPAASAAPGDQRPIVRNDYVCSPFAGGTYCADTHYVFRLQRHGDMFQSTANRTVRVTQYDLSGALVSDTTTRANDHLVVRDGQIVVSKFNVRVDSVLPLDCQTIIRSLVSNGTVRFDTFETTCVPI